MSEFGWIEMDGLVNLRDVGGKPTADGQQTRRGAYLRCDNLQDLPPESVRRFVEDFGVSDVVDLRTGLERSRAGEGPLKSVAGITFHELTMYPEQAAETGIPDDQDDPDEDPELPWQSEEAQAGRSETTHEEHLARHYLGYLERRPDNVVKALQAIAHAEGAVLVHCAAGKDRTGTITAMMLTLLGVPRELVVADYDASNQRVDKIFARLAGSSVYADDLAHQTVADQRTPAETMQMLLAAVDAQFGSVAGWLAAHGWSDDDTRALRARMLVPGDKLV